MENKINEEHLLVEYKMAQQSAEHHDNTEWQNVSTIWGGSLVLLGFVLNNLQNRSLKIPIIIACSLGIILTAITWYRVSVLRKVRTQKYDRCKYIEGVFGFTQHSNLKYPKNTGFIFLSIIMACFILVWSSLIIFLVF